MTFRMIKPFVVELITFVLVLGVVFGALLVGEWIEITFHIHLLTVVAVAFVFVALLSLFSRIVNTGIRALTDYIFQSVIEDSYTFLNEQPYKASIFTEKFYDNHERAVGMYYLVHFEKDDKIYTYISPSYIKLEEGKVYSVKAGRSSHIFLGALEK